MNLTVIQTATAVGPGLTVSFGSSSGTAPFSFSVLPGGAGGTIGASSGTYTAPASVPQNPAQLYDTIEVVDSIGTTGIAKVLIGDPLLLFCDIIQNQLGLAPGRVYIWDQKNMQPTDNALFVEVSVLSCKPFGNNKSYSGGTGLTSVQTINMSAQLQVDMQSRDTSALFKKEAALMALQSDYAEMQQNANSFFIGKLPSGGQLTNLSSQDGAAIPYRFVFTVTIQYLATISQATGYMTPSAAPTINYVQN